MLTDYNIALFICPGQRQGSLRSWSSAETVCFDQLVPEFNSDIERRDEDDENHSDRTACFDDESYDADYNSEATAVCDSDEGVFD